MGSSVRGSPFALRSPTKEKKKQAPKNRDLATFVKAEASETPQDRWFSLSVGQAAVKATEPSAVRTVGFKFSCVCVLILHRP